VVSVGPVEWLPPEALRLRDQPAVAWAVDRRTAAPADRPEASAGAEVAVVAVVGMRPEAARPAAEPDPSLKEAATDTWAGSAVEEG
jgi:hypothetical protein